MELTPRVLIGIIKANDSLYSDVTRESFLTHMRKWYSLTERLDNNTEASDENEQTLLTIRQNVLHNVTLRLASEESMITQSLAEYSDSGELLPKRIFPAKTTAKFLKLVSSTKALDIDLTKPESGEIPLAFHCGHCPSMAHPRVADKKRKRRDNDDGDDDDDDDDSDGRRAAKRDKLVFVSDHLADFNVLKAQPIDSLEDFLRHNAAVHRVGKPNVVAETGAHCYCIVCRLCDASTLKDAFVCCLGAYRLAQ